jgi:hypothetical protein
MANYPATAAGVVQYLGDLGQKVRELGQRVAYDKTRNDSLERAAAGFSAVVDSMTRQMDRSVAREYRQFERERADEADAEREQARRDTEACKRHQARYDSVFSQFAVATPPPVAGEAGGDYRRRLLRHVLDRLPRNDRLYDIRPGGLDSDAIKAVEPAVFASALREAAYPSYDNLPPPGEHVARHRVDPQTGARYTEFYGRRSFIADCGQPGRRIERIQNPKTGQILYGPPYERMPNR